MIWSLAKWESEYLLINRSSCSPLYMIYVFFMAFKYYWRMIFTTLLYWWEEFFANWLTTNLARAISGLVSTIKNIIDPFILWSGSYLAAMTSFSLGFRKFFLWGYLTYWPRIKGTWSGFCQCIQVVRVWLFFSRNLNWPWSQGKSW